MFLFQLYMMFPFFLTQGHWHLLFMQFFRYPLCKKNCCCDRYRISRCLNL